MSAEQQVIDALHKHTDICAGADTCGIRELIAPLVNEVEALKQQNECVRKALSDHERDRQLLEEILEKVKGLAHVNDWCDDCHLRVPQCVCP